MPKYNSGEEVRIGDVISVRFTVTNVVPDGDRLNIVARPSARHHGQPDDVRYQFSSSAVALLTPAPVTEPEPEKPPEPEPAPADQDSQTAPA